MNEESNILCVEFNKDVKLTKTEMLFIDTILSSIIKVPELEDFINKPRQGTSFSLKLIDKMLQPCSDSFAKIKKHYEDKINLQNR